MRTVPRLRDARERQALTLRELGALAGVGFVTIWRLEQGRPAQLRTIRKLAAALGVKPADLMEPAPGEARAA